MSLVNIFYWKLEKEVKLTDLWLGSELNVRYYFEW
jgi:hypothetical protein